MILYDGKGRIKLQKKIKKKDKKGKVPAQYSIAFSSDGSPAIVPSSLFIRSVSDIHSDPEKDWITAAEQAIRMKEIRRTIDYSGDNMMNLIRTMSQNMNGNRNDSKSVGKLSKLDDIAEYLLQVCINGSYDSVDLEDDPFSVIFEALNISSDDESMNILSKFVSAAKGFYEYSDKILVNDIDYDRSIEVLKENGKYEPSTIAPVHSKGRVKVVDDEMSELAINMNKSYAVYDTDKIPDGSASTTTVKDWLEISISKALETDDDEKIHSASVGVTIDRKFDGVAVRAIVEDGVIHKALSRGDYDGRSPVISGLEGYVLSKHIKGRFACQFEAVVTDEAFNNDVDLLTSVNIARYGLKRAYASKRSMASAIINRMCSIDGYSPLSDFIKLIPVAVMALDNKECEIGLLDKMRDIITPGITPITIVGTISECLSRIDSLLSEYSENREPDGLPTDGIVLSLNSSVIKNAVGRTNRTNNWQLAYKFEPEVATGIVSGVSISSGRKGGKGILIHLKEAVELGGNKYAKIPVGSKEVFNNLDLHVGDKVLVSYINDVMPQISMVSHRGNGDALVIPEVCNCCGQPLTIRNKRPFCENISCKDNISGRIFAFIDSFSSSDIGNLTKFITNSYKISNAGFDGVASFIDAVISESFPITNMTTSMKESLRTLRNELIVNLPKKKNYEILSYVGVPGIGQARAKELIDKFGSYRKLIDAVESFNIETTTITGKRMISILAELKRYIYDVKAMLKFVDNDEFPGYVLTASPLGCSISIANSVDRLTVGHSGYQIKNDDKILAICEEHDFEITDGKKFDVLIVKSLDSKSSKVEKAKKKKIPMFTPKEFIKFYSGI